MNTQNENFYLNKKVKRLGELKFYENIHTSQLIDILKKEKSRYIFEKNCYFPLTLEDFFRKELVSENSAISVEKLLDWGSSIISVFSKEITIFNKLKLEYENHLFSGEIAKASCVLLSIEKKIGYSLWLIQQKILLAVLSEDTFYISTLLDNFNEQKPQNNKMIELFIMFYLDMFNKKVSFEKYNSNVENFLNPEGKKSQLWHYVKYKLDIGTLKSNYEAKISLIFDEQLSLIDYYETFTDTLMTLSINDRYSSFIGTITKKLASICSDTRLINLDLSLNGSCRNIRINNEAIRIIEKYTCGDLNGIDLRIKCEISRIPSCFEMVLLGIKCGNIITDSSFINELFAELSKIYSLNHKKHWSLEIVSDYYKLLYFTSWRYKLLRVMTSKLSYDYNGNALHLSRLNDKTSIPLYVYGIRHSKHQIDYLNLFKKISPVTIELMMFSITGDIRNDLISKIDYARWNFYKVVDLLQKGNTAIAIKICEETLKNSDFTLQRMYYQERIRRLLFIGYITELDLEKALNLYVESYLINEELVANMRLESLVQLLNDDNFESIKANVCRPIVFSIFYKNNHEDLLMAYFDYIEFNGFQHILEMLLKEKDFDERFVIFLSKVCTQSFLKRDYYAKSVFRKTAADLRVEILRFLIDYDIKADRLKEYYNELNEIFKHNQLLKKIDSFNHNRIFIDTENLYSHIKVDLELEIEKYETIQKLKSVGVLNKKSEQINSLLLKLVENYLDRIHFFKNIATKIMREYLNESPYSLETFLSTRIRHNFCNDNLKRVFEEEKLFSKKVKDDSTDYIINDYWKNSLSDNDYNKVIDLLAKFSLKINEKIQEVKDKWIRIRIDSSNEGLFDYTDFVNYITTVYELSDIAFKDIPNFYNFIISELNSWTKKILKSIKALSDDDLKMYYSSTLSELEASVKNLSIETNAQNELLRNIERSKAKYGDDIEKFKEILNMDNERYPDFNLTELVDFCVKIEEEVNPKFTNIKFNKEITSEKMINGSKFSYLVDILGILIRNTIEHSNLDSLEELIINLKIDESCLQINEEQYKYGNGVINSSKSITMTVKNNINVQNGVEQLNEKLYEKISNIYSMKFLDRSITEGGSGLYKTARTIYYNLKSNFRYEYLINENEFEIKVNFEV